MQRRVLCKEACSAKKRALQRRALCKEACSPVRLNVAGSGSALSGGAAGTASACWQPLTAQTCRICTNRVETCGRFVCSGASLPNCHGVFLFPLSFPLLSGRLGFVRLRGCAFSRSRCRRLSAPSLPPRPRLSVANQEPGFLIANEVLGGPAFLPLAQAVLQTLALQSSFVDTHKSGPRPIGCSDSRTPPLFLFFSGTPFFGTPCFLFFVFS